MTKKELINNIRIREGLTWDQATRIVNGIFDDISDEVAENKDMYIPKFGRFFISKISTKHCKHPITKEDCVKPAHDIVRFRMAEDFRRKITERR